MFTLKNVTKKYGEVIALEDINLTIQEQKTTVLLGQSGCGKSTLLRLLVGLIEPSQGTILFQNEELTADKIMHQRRKMGYVIQDGGLFPHLTARKNVILMAQYLGKDSTDIEERLNELSELTHLQKDALDRFPAFLSGGQQQRISLMRALMLEPDVLLLDEPLGALDPMIRAGLQKDLREVFQRLNKTVIMVTHDLAEAAYFAENIILLHEGKILQEGSIHDLIHNPSDPFVSRFINAQREMLENVVEK